MTQSRGESESSWAMVVNLTRGTTLADRTEYARGPWRRLVGLLGRATLASGEGIIFTPCIGLHTIGMRFPIDLVYLRRTMSEGPGAVVERLRADLRPYRIAPARADLVLELPAGTIATTVTSIGDELELRPWIGVADECPTTAGPVEDLCRASHALSGSISPICLFPQMRHCSCDTVSGGVSLNCVRS